MDSDTQDGKDADLQILFVSEQHHWILSSFHENDVSIYDSPHFPLPHLWSSNHSRFSGGSKGGGNTGHIPPPPPPPPLEPSNAVLLGRGLAVATYISLTSHLLPPESRLLAS